MTVRKRSAMSRPVDTGPRIREIDGTVVIVMLPILIMGIALAIAAIAALS